MTPKLGRILVADDEPTLRDLFEETLSGSYDVRLAEDGSRAKALLDHETFDLVFLDLRMPGRDGAELLKLLKSKANAPRAVIMSAHAGPERRRELLAEGADRFLAKPFDPEVIEETARVLTSSAAGIQTPASREVIAEAPAMKAVLQVARRIASTRVTVLLQGETGTGKEVLAHEIHRRSSRADRPFIRVNCAAISEDLLESELFGHERGSFTGAVSTTPGVFKLADGGTLLLDEISEISPKMQRNLLRVLQEREVRKVGGSSTIPVDVRVLATTNRDLAAEAAAGRFRADLFHRLNVVRLDVPPLRERTLDIPSLADVFLAKKAFDHDLPKPLWAPDALERLLQHNWPGNVRELENAVERSLLLARDGVIRADDLALESTMSVASATPWRGETLESIECAAIQGALRQFRGNRTHAAAALGISVRTIRNKLRTYRTAGIQVEEVSR